jgi:DsbC/DsbD-like thiol-disulfide interchange protein
MGEADDDLESVADFEIWRVYDAGGPSLRLVVRYREEIEEPDWRNGPDIFAALQQAAAEGWEAYDREPGEAPGEVTIYHMKRERPTSPP